MWAVSEILDSAKDAIFILVGVPLTTNHPLAKGHGRIGGSLQSCTFGMHAEISQCERAMLISAHQPTPSSE
jgi:hypothetical protein